MLTEHSDKIHLPLWTEIVGTFHGLFADDRFTYVKVNDKLLSFPKESMESEIIRDKLNNALIGRKIGLLRCDEPSLLIRIIAK